MKKEVVKNKNSCKKCKKQLKNEWDRYYLSDIQNYHVSETYCSECFDIEHAKREKRRLKLYAEPDSVVNYPDITKKKTK